MIARRLPQRWRGTSLSLFNSGVQAGFDAPFDLVVYVLGVLRERIDARSSSPDQRAGYAEVLRVLVDHPDEALDYARATIAYETLSPAEKERDKKRRREADQQAAWSVIPPSEAQIEFLGLLGHSGATPATMAEASAIITALKSERGGQP